MNIHDLRDAQARYENRIEEIIEKRKKLHKLRASFINYFDIHRVNTMDINDYVAGVELPKIGYNFCYTLERKLDGLGRISGSSAPKFGIYFGKRGKNSQNWIFRCKGRHDSATTKYATHSAPKVATIPLQSTPLIPLQSTPLYC